MAEKKGKKRERKTVRLTNLKGDSEKALHEMVIFLMNQQEALIHLLVDKKVFSREEFEAQVDKEISGSVKL